MPQIYMRNMSLAEVSQLSLETTADLAAVIGCPPDWLVFHQCENHSFVHGKPCTKLMILVDVFWFKRTQAIQDQVASILTEKIKSMRAGTDVEVTIVFHTLENDAYYEDGKHY